MHQTINRQQKCILMVFHSPFYLLLFLQIHSFLIICLVVVSPQMKNQLLSVFKKSLNRISVNSYPFITLSPRVIIARISHSSNITCSHHGQSLPLNAHLRESWPYIPSFPASTLMHGNSLITARVVQVIHTDAIEHRFHFA